MGISRIIIIFIIIIIIIIIMYQNLTNYFIYFT